MHHRVKCYFIQDWTTVILLSFFTKLWNVKSENCMCAFKVGNIKIYKNKITSEIYYIQFWVGKWKLMFWFDKPVYPQTNVVKGKK